jgi:hypothetical protein
MEILSPNQFKSLYKDDFIKSVKVWLRRKGVSVPIVYAEVIDVTDDVMVYWYDEGHSVWHLFAHTP